MPKRSDDTLLKFAIPAAVLDRESLAEAYSHIGREAEDARKSAAEFQRLSGKKLSQLTEDERDAARRCFIYAEQYEQSRAYARVETGTRWERDPARKAASFKEVRMRLWGKTKLEAATAGSKAVPLTELLKRSREGYRG